MIENNLKEGLFLKDNDEENFDPAINRDSEYYTRSEVYLNQNE